jgi:hypothetical protein
LVDVITGWALNIVSFVTLLILFSVGFALLKVIVKKIVSLPAIKTTDKILGMIFSLLKCLIIILIVLSLASAIFPLNNYLKPNGIILLIVSNKFGIKRFAIVDEFENTIKGLGKGYTKNQIENKLEECKYKNYKFYYPLPDYNVTNIILKERKWTNHMVVHFIVIIFC